MFGYVRPCFSLLTEEKKRYRSVYCGLCRRLNDNFGGLGRMGLSYDMTFLCMLLSSLYEPEETETQKRCLIHPLHKHTEAVTAYTDYAADMTVVLTYFKSLDDWQDERKATGKAYASLLKKHYDEVRTRRRKQCEAVEKSIMEISKVENNEECQAEEAANWSGKMLAAVFTPHEDLWQADLARLGFGIGKFILLMDAWIDFEGDMKKGRFNPLTDMGLTDKSGELLLRQPLGMASDAFERLPLVKDLTILRNILYAGVWQELNLKKRKDSGDGH